jgi:hypothetical protein
MDSEQKWMMPAKLLNISSGGGLVYPGRLAATGRRLCLLFERVPDAGWIDAEVVRAAASGYVGIRFRFPFRTEFLRALTSKGNIWRRNSESKTPYLGDVIPTW